ncbi:hypothetical protein SAMN05443247_11234 [Bradyrhizobium erythrophlei]|nr:hypothetical protein SAMN05443247_11234 [Bradyrhizobium erythrophlei]
MGWGSWPGPSIVGAWGSIAHNAGAVVPAWRSCLHRPFYRRVLSRSGRIGSAVSGRTAIYIVIATRIHGSILLLAAN